MGSVVGFFFGPGALIAVFACNDFSACFEKKSTGDHGEMTKISKATFPQSLSSV